MPFHYCAHEPVSWCRSARARAPQAPASRPPQTTRPLDLRATGAAT